jgi:hypothetical protein
VNERNGEKEREKGRKGGKERERERDLALRYTGRRTHWKRHS